MTARTKKKLVVDIQAPANGTTRRATVTFLDKPSNDVLHTDRADMQSAAEREKVARRAAGKLKTDERKLLRQIEDAWHKLQGHWRQAKEEAAAGSPSAAPEVQVDLLDAAPPTVTRPLSLLDGNSYAATWVPVRRRVSRSVDPKTGAATNYDPPLEVTENGLVIVRNDGQLFADAALPGARPMTELGLPVRLPVSPAPEKTWSGAGVKRYLSGERPDPVEVFRRVASVFDRFLDFARSLATQEAMCELMACGVLSTYLLDAFHVVGYLWPNGERGAGKTVLLDVYTLMAYLGQLILAGSSYPTLRDMADYGATLAFDDAEDVMDPKRSDPDKRALLLAGNRRGVTVSVKELVGDHWETRHIHTFCPRLFSAIRQPDPVLGSRSIIIPLVRSGDPQRAKANPSDPEHWPCDRRQLVDDLWALGLEHLPRLSAHDRQAAEKAQLMGRELDPWRPVLAVAHWLQNDHAVDGLYDRLEKLANEYQGERNDFEDTDTTRVLFRALLRMRARGLLGDLKVLPKEVAAEMNSIAREENLSEDDKEFITARRVGWALKRHRFERPRGRDAKGKHWIVRPHEIEAACRAYGIAPEEVATPGTDEEACPGTDESPF